MAGFLELLRLRIGDENLVFVVAISQLAYNLKEDISITGFLGFVFLFIPVWWSWIGTTMYANRFENDDIGRRLLVVLQMVTAAAMAVNIHHGLSENAPGFAIAYSLSRFVLVLEYLRAGIHIPQARLLTTRYAVGFAIAFLGKALLPVAVIGAIAVVAAIQVIQDLSGDRPTAYIGDVDI
jgi:low temperature requirement protein LtrA